MNFITNLLETADRFLWDGFLVFILIGVGAFLTFRLRGMQFRYLHTALKYAFSRHDNKAQGDITQFQSLMIAMAATIGIGSIAGMATAVIGGGFGAIFWMWVIALIGMATKYSEAILAVKYRQVDHRGEMCGGPMYYIQKGLGWKWLGVFFAIFGTLAAFGGGNIIQSQSIADALFDLVHLPHYITGIILALLTGFVIMGGVKNLGRINAVFVPAMAVFYICGGLIILILHIEKVPDVIALIFKSAFSKEAAIGGGALAAIQLGIARGISSNEAGLGSAPIAAAAAKTDLPGRQALISMTGVFISSFIICTLTVLVLGVTGVVGKVDITGKLLNGAPLVMEAFRSAIPGGSLIVAIGLVLFGFSTILGWSYYGEKCIEYIFGEKIIWVFRLFFIAIVFVGAIMGIGLVWPIADIMNGLMAFPNLLALFFLSDIVVAESKIFFDFLKKEKQGSKVDSA